MLPRKTDVAVSTGMWLLEYPRKGQPIIFRLLIPIKWQSCTIQKPSPTNRPNPFPLNLDFGDLNATKSKN